jgi:hypothetical protein
VSDERCLVNALEIESEFLEDIVLNEAGGLERRFGQPSPEVVEVAWRPAISSPSTTPVWPLSGRWIFGPRRRS